MTVWIYVDTTKQVGDKDHLEVFANEDAGKRGFRKLTPKASRSSMRFWSMPKRLTDCRARPNQARRQRFSAASLASSDRYLSSSGWTHL